MTAPASRFAISSAATVMTGMDALRSTCRRTIGAVADALGPARPHVVLAELLDDAGPRDAGERGHRTGRRGVIEGMTSELQLSAPDAGRMLQVTAQRRMSRMPLQNVGMLCPTSTTRHQERLDARPRQTPVITPTGSPIAQRDGERAGREEERVGQAGGDDAARPARAGRARCRGPRARPAR